MKLNTCTGVWHLGITLYCIIVTLVIVERYRIWDKIIQPRELFFTRYFQTWHYFETCLLFELWSYLLHVFFAMLAVISDPAVT
jgi:hypothetical protein